MTTVFGITAKDPIRNKPYGVIVGDSQNSTEDKICYDFKGKKVYCSKDANRIIGSAGTALNIEDYDYSPEIKKQFDLLNEMPHPKIEDLKSISEKINVELRKEKKMGTHFLFMDYKNKLINLHKYAGKFNEKIVAGAIGSGQKYVSEIFPELISKYIKGKEIICPIEELVPILIQSMNYATQDDYTGGFMTLGIKTPTQTLALNPFSRLTGKSEIEKANRDYNRSAQNLLNSIEEQNPNLKGRKLEDLLFI